MSQFSQMCVICCAHNHVISCGVRHWVSNIRHSFKCHVYKFPSLELCNIGAGTLAASREQMPVWHFSRFPHQMSKSVRLQYISINRCSSFRQMKTLAWHSKSQNIVSSFPSLVPCNYLRQYALLVCLDVFVSCIVQTLGVARFRTVTVRSPVLNTQDRIHQTQK